MDGAGNAVTNSAGTERSKAMSEIKPGAVCSNCGRTVTESEYSSGESVCCGKEVIAEEEYGKPQDLDRNKAESKRLRQLDKQARRHYDNGDHDYSMNG
jgi:hypothetical protein